jgi:hypothetical protein
MTAFREKHLSALVLTSILFIFLGAVRAQGPQQLVTVPIGPGSTAQGWLYLPADYAVTTKKYPVVLFFHGSGEAGQHPDSVLRNGIPRLIVEGMRPDNITNPLDNQSYSFIVLSLQHWSWSPLPQWLPHQVEWLKQNYRIDTNRVYVTGLSAGGQSAFHAATYGPSVSSLIAAAVPMSLPALGSHDMSMLNTYQIKTWFLSGSTDPYTANAQNYSAQANSVYPGSSRVTVYQGGHCCWKTVYHINWNDPVSGLSIWEWLLTQTRMGTPQPLPVRFTDFKATSLGNRQLKVEFSYEDADGNEDFFIRIWVKGVEKNIRVQPSDRVGPGRFSKIINLDQ